MRAKPRRIGVLLYDGITALDVAGPMDAFASTRLASNEPGYELCTIGLTRKEVVAECGLQLRPQTTLTECPRLDTIVIPGGEGLRRERTNRIVADWIKRREPVTRRIAAVCTGIYGLAPTGLLNGKIVTTHWRYAAELARKFPALQVDANALFLRQGKIYTSAGITAGIDLCLALIEEDYSLATARDLVVFMKRHGGQQQYSEPLRFQFESSDRTTDMAAHIRSNLDQDLSVTAMAEVAHLSYRQFTRTFRAAFHCSPAAFVEGVRLDEARTRLCESRCRMEQLATSVGFGSDDAFRRAFERRFGVSPSHYRTRFGGER